MHILLIHQAFATEDEAGGTRHYEIGKYLSQKGHVLTAVASTVNYQTRQTIKKLKGKRLPQQGPGLVICRAWAYPTRRGVFWGRLMAFVSFMITSFLVGLNVRKVDMVWGTSPPIFQAITAYLLARLKGVPFVLEVRDLWPDFAISTGILHNRFLILLSRYLERFLYHNADQIMTNSPGFIPIILSRGSAKFQTQVVSNGVDIAMFSNPNDQELRGQLGLEGKFVAIYAGAHGLANDLETVLAAAKILRKHQDVVFVLMGDGPLRDSLMQKARDEELNNVQFIPPQPKARVPSYLAVADVCIATLKAVPMFDTTYPNKVFDYMAARRPTLLAIDGAIRDVVEKADGGRFVPPGDAQALAEATMMYYRSRELRLRQGENARLYAEAYFDRPVQAAKAEAIFQKALRDHVMKGWFRMMFKRILDIISSLVALLFLAIPFAIFAIAIKLDSRGPVFFRQERVGLKGGVFKPWKFRTMVDGAVHTGLGLSAAKDDPRITRVGRFLRNTGIDELPQFINVLMGQMSLVGPRPTVPSQVERYDDAQRRRLLAKPGVTGLAVVRGRNALSWEERIKLDTWYIDHWSIWLDIKILALTPWKVLVTREGLYGEDGVNEDFGSPSQPSLSKKEQQ
ncbi:MAG: sugar transferase [Chloroflexi bacterium]|nr:sugar transferase [Chloroflexota bacterium]